MAVNAIEVESPSPVSPVQPQAVFQDQNLTVYGIPLYPDGQDAIADKCDVPTIENTSGKRKRSMSPVAAAKRQHLLHSSTALYSSLSRASALICF